MIKCSHPLGTNFILNLFIQFGMSSPTRILWILLTSSFLWCRSSFISFSLLHCSILRLNIFWLFESWMISGFRLFLDLFLWPRTCSAAWWFVVTILVHLPWESGGEGVDSSNSLTVPVYWLFISGLLSLAKSILGVRFVYFILDTDFFMTITTLQWSEFVIDLILHTESTKYIRIFGLTMDVLLSIK